MIKKITLLLILTFFSFSIKLNAQSITENKVALKGAARQVDVAKDTVTIQLLTEKTYAENGALIDTILKHPNDYNPTVLFVLSKVLFNADRKDDASFWFYLAQLRTRYDFNRCTDPSCEGTVAELTSTFGPDIDQYAIFKPEFLEKTIDKVIDFEKNNNENYDQRWINLQGLAVTSPDNKDKASDMSKPQQDWPQIKTQTISDYANEFKEFIVTKGSK
ncbi:hypothetical protein ACPPVU_08770 [Mucilaginibacter sp. McL0603]|uniref:hypothetical protein n=1 Tax=Mucilaginibacter sp. McL0603 TaxID=3415670 RepID=UPI003CF48E26